MTVKNRAEKAIIAILALLIVLSCAVGLVACNRDEFSDTLIVGTTTTIDTLNRLDASGGSLGYAYTMLSSTLAQVPLVYRSGSTYGSVLCDFENSADGLDWKFTLKDGFYWHDDTPVTAYDLKYTFENALSENTVQSITAEDKTVTVSLKRANILFLDGLISVILQPKHILENVTKDTITDAQSVIGCGPFRFLERNPESGTITFVRYDKYPNASDIALKTVIFKQYGSADSMYLALKAGEIDTVWNYGGGLDANASVDLGGESSLSLVSYATTALPKVLFFNNKKMTDLKVKSAIKKAIDYEKLARIFGTSESALPREGFVAPNILGYKATAELKRDLQGAKTLLNDAGYSDANKFEFKLLVRASGNDSQYADLIKTDLEETGMITVTLEVKGSDWQSYYQEGNHMASLASVSAAGYNFEAGYATRYLLTTENSVMQAAGFAKNPVAHGQLEIDDGAGNLTEFGRIRSALADAVTVNEEFLQAVANYQDYFVANTPAIALIYDSKVQVVNKNISGYTVDSTFGILNVQSIILIKKAV